MASPIRRWFPVAAPRPPPTLTPTTTGPLRSLAPAQRHVVDSLERSDEAGRGQRRSRTPDPGDEHVGLVARGEDVVQLGVVAALEAPLGEPLVVGQAVALLLGQRHPGVQLAVTATG